MAHHHSLTHSLLFESHSPSGSKWNKDGCGELQNTAVFDDTMVLDSPLDEIGTQLENVCFYTEKVDHVDDDDNLGDLEDVKGAEPGFDTEIVLDSEDDGICKTMNKSNLDRKTTGRSEREAVDLQKRETQTRCLDEDSTDKQFGAGKDGSTVNLDTNDRKEDVPQFSECDHVIGRLQCVDSQEPEESSQANALSFVDNFLAFNDVDVYQGGEERTSARKRSPLVSSAKGTQRLAKIIKRGSPVKEMRNFDWLESDHHGEADSLSKRMTASSECRDFNQETDKRHQSPHNNGERSLSNEHEEKKEFADLHNDIGCPSHSPPSFTEQGMKVRISIEQDSEKNLINGTVKELDEFKQTESSWEKYEASASARDIPDTFDVGIGTQIAAEAMEALFYGPPLAWKAGDQCKDREDNLTDLPEGETKKRNCLDQHSLQNNASPKVGNNAKSILNKPSSRRYGKEVSSSSWNSNYQLLDQKIKPKPCKSKSKQSKVDKDVSTNNQEKCERYASASIPDEEIFHRKQLSEEEPVIHQSRHLEGEASLKGIKDQLDKPRIRSMLAYKRKRKHAAADPPKLLSGKKKCSERYSNASAEAFDGKFDGKLTEQGQISPEEDTLVRFLRLNAWNCPKGRRTRRKVPVNSSGASNMHASLINIGAEENNPHSVDNQKMPEDCETTSNNFNRKGWMHTTLSQFSIEHNSDKSSSRQNCNDSAVTSIRISARNSDKSKAIQTGKPDYVDSTSTMNGLENHSFGKSPRKSVEPSGSECNTAISCTRSVNEAPNSMLYVYHRRPRNKNLPKPSLLKELIGLGVPESISDFTRKSFRTRREVACVRVMFSQHLGDDIIKQQKKISGRLGVSITSCSMDATHFVADEFVRTRNMLEAIALGKQVVTHLWLDSCGQASCLLDEKNYILRDSKREKELGFSMPVSLARARQYPLLKDKKVFITQNVKPNKEMITSLVKAVGGGGVETSQELAEDLKIPEDLLILSCEQDLAICVPFLDKGAAVYTSELLLNGIVTQKMEHERYKLFADFVEGKRIIESNRRSRRSSKR